MFKKIPDVNYSFSIIVDKGFKVTDLFLISKFISTKKKNKRWPQLFRFSDKELIDSVICIENKKSIYTKINKDKKIVIRNFLSFFQNKKEKNLDLFAGCVFNSKLVPNKHFNSLEEIAMFLLNLDYLEGEFKDFFFKKYPGLIDLTMLQVVETLKMKLDIKAKNYVAISENVISELKYLIGIIDYPSYLKELNE